MALSLPIKKRLIVVCYRAINITRLLPALLGDWAGLPKMRREEHSISQLLGLLFFSTISLANGVALKNTDEAAVREVHICNTAYYYFF